jgi:hypothetical protein
LSWHRQLFKSLALGTKPFPDFIIFPRHRAARIENQSIRFVPRVTQARKRSFSRRFAQENQAPKLPFSQQFHTKIFPETVALARRLYKVKQVSKTQ